MNNNKRSISISSSPHKRIQHSSSYLFPQYTSINIPLPDIITPFPENSSKKSPEISQEIAQNDIMIKIEKRLETIETLLKLLLTNNKPTEPKTEYNYFT